MPILNKFICIFYNGDYMNLFLTIICTLFTWGVTALGAAMIFFFKNINNKLQSLIYGFGAGVMIAASFFSLLLPGIELTISLNQITWIITGLGFLVGCCFILLIDILLPHLHQGQTEPEGIKSNINRKILLILAIVVHNIPEGMAIGVSFASANLGIDGVTTMSAVLLAIGIGLQNFPEGTAVSLPLVSDGMSKRKAFFYGQLTGIVEPIGALLGYALAYIVRSILPFILSFAAGAMIYVVVEELIPSGKQTNKWGTIGVIFGFTIMMVLDIALS